MGFEFKYKESIDIKSKMSENFKEIKPKNDISNAEAKQNGRALFEKNDNVDNEISQSKSNKIYIDDNGVKFREGNELLPNKTIEIDGYTYKTDKLGRPTSAEGKLQIKKHEGRMSMKEDKDVVAKGKMPDKYDIGHLIGDQFNGRSELFNVVPMDSNFNRGTFKNLEKDLRKAVDAGSNVTMKVEVKYNPLSKSAIPTKFKITYSIDGKTDVKVLKNRSKQ